MISLSNDQLRIDLLDPIADRALLGPRFCWGGFIWQIHDRDEVPLLRGPEWPARAPSPWNAQGLPESFRHRTRTGTPLTWNGNRGVAIGAGELALNAVGEPVVVTPCSWEIVAQPECVNFHTRQQAAGFDYALNRRIELNHRVVLSLSELTNHGETALQLAWFAHPFFALPDELIRAELPEGTELAENPGFALNGRTLTQKRKFLNGQDGHMDFLKLPSGKTFTAQLRHPALNRLEFACSFVPAECIVWGNANTFSLEPYQTIDLAPGQTLKWHLRYVFDGAMRKTDR